jgi:hypothetical protein
MTLLIYYVSIVLFLDVVAALLCLLIERFSPAASLPIFIGLYFTILWAAWQVAVRISEPKTALAAPAAVPPLPTA